MEAAHDRSQIFDLHTHALPGVDDGPTSSCQTLDMLGTSFAQGVVCTAMTPHCIIHEERDVEQFLERRQNATARILRKMKGRQINSSLLVGAEVFADHDVSRRPGIESLCYEAVSDDSGAALGISPEITRKCMLMELPMRREAAYLPECIYNLNSKGIRVILAHVERYANLEGILHDTKSLDVYYQLNSSSILGLFGKKLLDRMLRRSGRVIISSDMHDLSLRPCDLGPCFDKIRCKFGRGIAEEVMCNSAKKALGIKEL